VRIEIAGRIDPLTIVPLLSAAAAAEPVETQAASDGPQLVLPAAWEQRCHLGLDELQRHYFTASDRFVEEVPLQTDEPVAASGRASDVALTAGLDRQLTALILGGRSCVPPIASAAHRRHSDRLLRRYQSTAARLVDALAV